MKKTFLEMIKRQKEMWQVLPEGELKSQIMANLDWTMDGNGLCTGKAEIDGEIYTFVYGTKDHTIYVAKESVLNEFTKWFESAFGINFGKEE